MTEMKHRENLPGTVFKFTNPSGKTVYKVELIIGYHPNGRKKTVRRTAHSPREAQRLQVKLADDLEKGLFGDSEMKKMDEFAMWWIRKVKAKKVRLATVADYEYRYKAHIQPTFGHRRLDQITARNITDWQEMLEKHPYSQTTVNGALQLLKAIFKAAVDHRKVAFSPAASVSMYSNPEHISVKKAWSREETLAVLTLSKGNLTELPILLGVHLTLRMEEVVGLKWSDFDLDEGTVTINRGLREVGLYEENGKRHFQMLEEPPKTVSSGRSIFVTRDVYSALLAQRERLDAKSLFRPDGWVFATQGKWPVRPSRMGKLYREFLKENGLRHIRFHDLRHTAVHLSFEAGVPIEAISQDAGHRDINTTKLIYGRIVPVLSSRRSEAIQDYLYSLDLEMSEPRPTEHRPKEGR